MSPRLRRIAVLASALALSCTATAHERRAPAPAAAAQASPAARWREDVATMSAATDAAGRRAFLRQRLQAAGMPSTSQAFEYQSQAGENLVAAVSGPASLPLLMIGAHSDRVEEGRGATDNASGSATALALAERFHDRPLQHHRVAVAFWDLEELGMRGSAAYVAQGRERPALYVNFDVFGWGDSLWMMSPDADSPLADISRDTAKSAHLQITVGAMYPPSDHRSFLAAQWPAVSYSMIDASEIPGILAEFGGRTPDPMPKVMTVIHSPNDTVAQIDADAAAKGVDAVEAAIRAWDARTP